MGRDAHIFRFVKTNKKPSRTCWCCQTSSVKKNLFLVFMSALIKVKWKPAWSDLLQILDNWTTLMSLGSKTLGTKLLPHPGPQYAATTKRHHDKHGKCSSTHHVLSHNTRTSLCPHFTPEDLSKTPTRPSTFWQLYFLYESRFVLNVTEL